VIPFNFGRPLVNERRPSPPVVSFPVTMTPPPSLPRSSAPSASPSSIPRPITARPLFSPTTCLPSKAPESLNFSSSSYVTPPTKRGGNVPSFIPQPVSSPSPMRVSVGPSNPKKITMPTFIRQPVRLPSVVTNGQKSVDGSNGSTQAHTIRRY
jgi:hypothetical protein